MTITGTVEGYLRNPNAPTVACIPYIGEEYLTFLTSDWAQDTTNQVYTLTLGSIKRCLNVYRVNQDNSVSEVELIDKIKLSNGTCMIRALSPFNGAAVYK